MLNFLNTAILFAAAAALFPFILHLFSKRKVKTVPFSSIAFLKAMRKHQVRAIKIRQLLLLIIRTLIILAVVLAFARPATKGGYLGSHASVSAVIIIDNSASMGLSVRDGILFDLVVKRAQEILGQLGQADEVAILATTGDYADPQGENIFGNPGQSAQIPDKISLTDIRADLLTSYSNAIELLGERLNLNHEIYILSDLQEISFANDEQIAEFNGKTFWVELPIREISNCSILEVGFGNQLIEIGTEFPISSTVKSYSTEGDDNILVSLYLDDERIAQEDIRLRPGVSAPVDFEISVATPGYHSGYVELSDDDLLADNRHYFSFYIPEQFNILLVGQDDIDRQLFKLALAPDEKLRRHWSVSEIGYNNFQTARLRDFDVVILSDYETLPRSDVNRLKDFVRRGGGLMLNIGQKSDSAHYAMHFEEMTGVKLTSSFPVNFSRAGHFTITDFNFEHPILQILKDKIDPQSLSFRSYALPKSRLQDDAEVSLIARYSDGSPAIAAAPFGRGRVLYLGCDISPDISDISLHPLFVPFLVRSCEFLSSDFSAHTENINAGDAPVRVLRRGFNIANEYILIGPDNSRRTVSMEFRDDTRRLNCDPVRRAGLYRIMNGTIESDRFAVNIDSEEGDFYTTDWDEMESRFSGASRMPSETSVAGFLSEKRFGRELWQFFIAAALILLALEMLVARDRGAPLTSDD
ncbi:MAG: BatA domain-containing protein [candidate division Zixibacteria bacterium]